MPRTPFEARTDLDGEVPPGPPAGLRGTLWTATRRALAILLGAVLAGAVWMIVVQKAFERGWTDQNFTAGMGVAVGATENDIPRNGFYVTMLAWIGIAVVYDLAARVARVHWLARAAGLGAAVLLLWGLVYCPVLDDRAPNIPAGVFGSEAGASAVVVALAAALAAALVLARVHDLVRDTRWWEAKHFDLRESMEAIFEGGSAPPPSADTPPPADTAAVSPARPPAGGR